MKNTPLISVVIPVYNREATIIRTIESIRRQSYQNIEIIVVDDGSHDDTYRICAEAQERDKRIIILRKKNEGVSSARNFGLLKSSGDYIAFVDSDDTIDKNMYNKMLSVGREKGADIVSCSLKVLYDGKNGVNETTADMKTSVYLSQTESIKAFLSGKLGGESVCNKLFLAKTITNTSFDRHLTRNEDKKFLFDAICNTKVVAHINEPLYFYHQLASSTTKTLSVDSIQDVYEVTHKIEEDTLHNFPELAKSVYLSSDTTYRRLYRTLLLNSRGNINLEEAEKLRSKIINAPVKKQLDFEYYLIKYSPRVFRHLFIRYSSIKKSFFKLEESKRIVHGKLQEK